MSFRIPPSFEVLGDPVVGARYVGFAKSKWCQLENRRIRSGAPLLTKTFAVGPVVISLLCSPHTSYIRILGNSVAYQIILVASGDLYGYSYRGHRIAVEQSTTNAYELLFPLALNKNFGNADEGILISSPKLAEASTTYLPRKYACFFDGQTSFSYEPSSSITFFNYFDGGFADAFSAVGNILDDLHFCDDEAVSIAGIYGAEDIDAPKAWNLTDPAKLLNYYPSSSAYADGFRWAPAVCNVWPEEAKIYGTFVGWYYGLDAFSPVFTDDDGVAQPLGALDVELKCFYEDKATGGSAFTFGWAETVTRYVFLDDTEEHTPNEIFFYFAVDGTPSLTYDSSTYINRAFGVTSVQVGASVSGYGSSVYVSYRLTPAMVNPDAKLWSHDEEVGIGDDVRVVPRVSCLLYGDSGIELYTAFNLVRSYYNCIGHDVSVDGRFVAFFLDEGDSKRVVVYDLFKGKEIDNTAVRKDFSLGSFVPTASNSGQSEGVAITSNSDTYIFEEESDYNNVLGWLSFVIEEQQRNYFQNVAISGRFAKLIPFADECRKNTIYVDSPSSPGEKHLVGSWADFAGGGKVRGSYALSDSEILFTPETDGSLIHTIKKNPTFGVALNTIDAKLLFGGSMLGEFIPGDCVRTETVDGVDTFYRDASCLERCGETYTIEGSSTCGQSLSAEFDNPYTPLVISGPAQMSIGALYGVTGGRGEVTLTGAPLTPTGTGTSWTVSGATCGPVTLEASDSCGNSTSLDVRGFSGSWVWKEHYYITGVGGGVNLPAACAEPGGWYSGGTYKYYVGNLTIITITVYVGPGTDCNAVPYTGVTAVYNAVISNTPCPDGADYLAPFGQFLTNTPPNFPDNCSPGSSYCSFGSLAGQYRPHIVRPVEWSKHDWVCC